MKNKFPKSETLTIADLLRSGLFIVPRHQRPYDWKPEHVVQLLEDIKDCINEGRPFHFLGTVMLIKGEGKGKSKQWLINDGQQRIITFSLLCAKLCRTFSEMGDVSRESEMVRNVFHTKGDGEFSLEGSTNLKIRIRPSSHDKQTNYELLLRGQDIGKHGKINTAWQAITNFFNENHQDKDLFKEVSNFIVDKLVVNRIIIASDSDSTAIFESLNARGKPLEQIQLLRNFFYSFFNTNADNERGETLHQKLNFITSILKDENLFSEYIRCYMQSRCGYLPSNNFYREFKRYINREFPTKESQSDEIYKLVAGAAQMHRIQIFKTLRDRRAGEDFLNQLTSHAGQDNASRKIDNYLQDLRNYTITNPIIFTLFCLYTDAKKIDKKVSTAKFVYKCSKLLSSLVQRTAQSRGNFKSSNYEKQFVDLANSIYKRTCNTPEKFLFTLEQIDKSTRVMSNQQYADFMNTVDIGSENQKAKYFLARIVENSLEDESINDSKCSLEHILPISKRFIDDWKVDKETHTSFVNRLGNLTLLKAQEDKPQTKHHKNFSTKKEIYTTSTYSITKDLCAYKEWDSDSIEQRQAELIKIATEIWNFKIN